MLVGKSLDAATATGAGAAIFTDVPETAASAQVSFTGGPSALVVRLEATLDGVNWQQSGDLFDLSGGDSSGKLVGTTFAPFVGLRANITTLSGGSSPTVTIWVGAA